MTKKIIIDLSMNIEEGMQTFKVYWHPTVKIEILAQHQKENRETRKLILGTHTGTHIDAPRHFIPKGKTIDQIPLSQLIGTATLIDFSYLDEFYEISLEELEKKLKGKNVEKIVARFDWDLNLNTTKYYTHHPFFSEEACKWLVKKGCKLLGLDTPQPDNPKNGRGSKNDAPNHKILLGGGIVLVEYLINLRKIKRDNFHLIVAPIKIVNGDGAPARCIGIINE